MPRPPICFEAPRYSTATCNAHLRKPATCAVIFTDERLSSSMVIHLCAECLVDLEHQTTQFVKDTVIPPQGDKFEIHASQGQGGSCIGPAFTTLKEALGYVKEHEGEASFGIKYPDGHWHNWGG